MYNNLGNLVSRVLYAENYSFTSTVFQPLKPPLDSEWNLVQAINNDKLKTLLTSILPSGFLQMGEGGTQITTMPGGATSVWANTLKFISPVAHVNGWLIHVGGGTNQFQTGTTENIWQILSSNEKEIAFIMGAPPSSGSRDDLLFLEVWEELITPTSQIYKYGFVQSGEAQFSNNLVDPNINQTTSLRTQVKYRIRMVEGVDFSSFREGVNHPSVFAQGATSTPNNHYNFLKTTQGYYVAGNGNQQDSVNLGTVDGYVYALPLFAVHRKNSSPYSISNVNGAGASIASGVSDRPDGTFYDQIAKNDIEDLRHLIDVNDDLEKICEESLTDVIQSVPTRLEIGTSAQTNSKVNMQIDGIAQAPARSFISSVFNRRPNGSQRSFSDCEIVQRSVQYFTTGTLSGTTFDLTPPVFYTATDSASFNDFNPYIGSGTIPTIYNASTGIPIAANTSVGMNGWLNLGDKLNKGVATFTPLNPSDITSNALIVEYDLVIPPGSGLSKIPANVYGITDDVANLPVAFTVDGAVKKTMLTRTTHGFTDYAVYRPVQNYRNPGSLKENFRAGAFELTYYMPGNGSNSITVPAIINIGTVSKPIDVSVLSVLKVQNVTTTFDIPLGVGIIPKVQNLSGGGGFLITFNSYIPGPADTVQVTLVMQGTLAEFSTFNKGVNNFATTEVYSFHSTGASSYSIPLSSLTGTNFAEYVYAVTGLSELGFITNAYCYTSLTQTGTQSLTQISSVSFNADNTILTISFTTAPASGLFIWLPMLVSYAPTTSNLYTVTYDTVPYSGFSKMLTPGESMEAEVVYLSKKALVTTSGTGGRVNMSPNSTIGAATRLPVNRLDADYTLANDNLQFTRSSNAVGTLKDADYFYNQYPGTGELDIGDLLLMTDTASATPQYVARGSSLASPLISYAVEDTLSYVEEDISTQVFTADGSTYNSTFILKNKIMSVFGTEALTLALPAVGIASFTQGQATVSGSGASFTSQLKAGIYIQVPGGYWYQIKKIVNDNSLILTEPFFETSQAGVQFQIFLPDLQFFVDGSRVPFDDIVYVDGNTSTVQINPSASYLQFSGAHQTPKFSVRYRTAANAMSALYGLAVGKGFVTAGQGTVAFTIGSLNVIGTGTNFPASVLPGWSIRLTGTDQWYEIASVTSVQVVTINVLPDVDGSLQGTYFNLNTTTQLYSFWFNVTGVGGPQPAGMPGLPVMVTVPENGSAVTIATVLATLLSSYPFSVTRSGNTLTVTNIIAGPVLATATAGTTGFTVTPSTSSVVVLTEPYNGQGVLIVPPSEVDADGDTDGPPISGNNSIVPGSYQILDPDLQNELLLFTLTTTSNTDIIDSINTNTFNLLKQGSANKLIFNNNLDTTLFQANRVLVAADLFYTKNRRLKVNQKV